MRESLKEWIGQADAFLHTEQLGINQVKTEHDEIGRRKDDLFIALVGELFDKMRSNQNHESDWSELGNALANFAFVEQQSTMSCESVSRGEAGLLAGTAFYSGGYPASAYVTTRALTNLKNFQPSGNQLACYELLARPESIQSVLVSKLIAYLRQGRMDLIKELHQQARASAQKALADGPDQWIFARTLEALLDRFCSSNIRQILPDGESNFWNSLVESFLDRKPATWDFFPSQQQAIIQGLLKDEKTYSLQMPTGAGKTTLCETLIYFRAKSLPADLSILIVPYRSLASELRSTLVRRLNKMGISSRCAYGGTVPSRNETKELEHVQVLVATPESLSGLLSADDGLLKRISMVICDEGHLLDSGERGISLELLLARLKAVEAANPKFVFISAIVPNVDEINAWLGGESTTIVKSDYKPALAEFAVLRPSGGNNPNAIALEMHPHKSRPASYLVHDFLHKREFRWWNKETARWNTYSRSSVKTQSIASARKALNMGTTAVFAANKSGTQGAIGLAEELLHQLTIGIDLPDPLTFSKTAALSSAVDYCNREYGPLWIGTRVLAAGAVLHHGDIPQETREVLEELLRDRQIALAICTSTLAEGVNLPIRTLVLYSVRRQVPTGPSIPLLTRDIKNLVGRAGRAGSSTKGLVICANPNQWADVEKVARQTDGEHVHGALRDLVSRLNTWLVQNSLQISNDILERAPALHSLVDGIDSTLIDLAAEEIGEESLAQQASELADRTFASSQATQDSRELLQKVFKLRAAKVISLRDGGRLAWVRETGAKSRLIDVVEKTLLPLRDDWADITSPLDSSFVTSLLEWAWERDEIQSSIKEAFRVNNSEDSDRCKQPFFEITKSWLLGHRFEEISVRSGIQMDTLLQVYTKILQYELQTLIEQSIALLEKLLESEEIAIAPSVSKLPSHLRFGVPDSTSLILAEAGVRHRSAAVLLGAHPRVSAAQSDGPSEVLKVARDLIVGDIKSWEDRLGSLVATRTVDDLSV